MKQGLEHNFLQNVGFLKAKVSKHAIYGLLIAISAIIVATVLVCYQQFGQISLAGLVNAQRSNVAIWILDLTPFLFTIWGQYVSSVVSYEAGALVFDQTNELRVQASALESKVAHETMHDSLTGLANRALLLDRLSQGLNQKEDHSRLVAILIININRFKEINDALGQYNGDRLLKQFALRLDNVVQPPGSVARLASDEFAVLLPDVSKIAEVEATAKRINQAIAISFVLESVTLDVSAAVGFALYPEHGNDADSLLQRASVAMYASKQKNAPYTCYHPSLDKNNPHKLLLRGELKRAIEQNLLSLHYQPKIDLNSKAVASVEALLRWNHPNFGIMNPEEFIPLAERAGLIRSLTKWVLNHALAQCRQWHQQGLDVGISINLSAVDALDVDLPDRIHCALAAYEIEPHYLTLELVESAFLADADRSLEILNRIAKLGVHLSIDDFGTGYSCLAYLSQLPIDEIKIDKSFVFGVNTSPRDEVIVKSTIDLAHNLGIRVVAEGVCSEVIFKQLQQMGCDIGQGFYISKPVNGEQLAAWLRGCQLSAAQDEVFSGQGSGISLDSQPLSDPKN